MANFSTSDLPLLRGFTPTPAPKSPRRRALMEGPDLGASGGGRTARKAGGRGEIVLAIDPGDTESAYACYDPGSSKLIDFRKVPNGELLDMLDQDAKRAGYPFGETPYCVVVEMIASYGMPVGSEIFETCVWVGRFMERAGAHVIARVYRKTIKHHLCGTTAAKDPNVRQALIDRFGPGKERAIGKKDSRGPLYGVSNDVWAALALAVAWSDGVREVEARP